MIVNVITAEMPTLPLLAGDLRFLASSPALVPKSHAFFTSTINIVSRVGNSCP